jgi:hypothetical protein
MGVDFIKRAAKTFKKSWDEGRKELGTSKLFTREPQCVGRSAPFELAPNASLAVGDAVTVELAKVGSALIARRGLAEMAHADAPPPELIRALQDSCGIGKGTVEQFHGLSGVVEILIC